MHIRNVISWSRGLLAAAAIVGALPSAVAQESLQQFEVELVIFRPTNPTGTPEDWSLEENRTKETLQVTDAEETPPPDAPVAPATGEGSESNFQPIDAAQFRMAAIESSLRRNRNYQLVTHVAWLQPGFAMNNPRPLAIESIAPADSGITGTVSVVRGRYLHVTLDLTFTAPDGKHYVLREQRRLRRSGEKHYFDHPYFGVIALLTPKQP